MNNKELFYACLVITFGQSIEMTWHAVDELKWNVKKGKENKHQQTYDRNIWMLSLKIYFTQNHSAEECQIACWFEEKGIIAKTACFLSSYTKTIIIYDIPLCFLQKLFLLLQITSCLASISPSPLLLFLFNPFL